MNHQPTITYFFLGANSKNGFHSLYHHFARGKDDTLHIIKGGPGTGKSTFMNRIGKAAEAQGLDVEYILCSGDPESLDGIYLPALHTGWVDGTAPHVLEPTHFGIDGSYVNLGQFCKNELLCHCREQIKTVTAAYRMCYQKAYMYLRSAGDLTSYTPVDSLTEQRIRSRAKSKFQKENTVTNNTTLSPVKRFLRAISCQGDYTPVHTLNALCDRVYLLESHFHLDAIFFDEIITQAKRENVYYIECSNPLSPDQIDALIFPDIRLCFSVQLLPPSFLGKTRTIHLDSYLERPNKTEHKQISKFKQQLMEAAYSQLSRAKQFHDELERYYRPALDIDALNAYTESTIDKLFQ